MLTRLSWRSWLPPLLTFAVLALLWQVVALLNPYILPSLGDVAGSLLHNPGMYWQNFLVTLLEVVVGSSGGVVLGFALAVLMCEFRVLERAIMPLVVVIMVTPVVAIAPVLVVAFGFGLTPKFIVTGIVVFFPILISSLAGLRGVDQRALDVLIAVQASRWEVLRELRLPGSMPGFFSGLRTSLPLAVVGAAVAEFVAAGQQAGLGSLVTIAAAQADLVVSWAAIFLLALLGLSLLLLLNLLSRRVLWWSTAK